MHDVYTRRLVTVNYSLFTHFKDLCLNFYVYLYMRSFIYIFISCKMYLIFYYSVTQMRLTFVNKILLIT